MKLLNVPKIIILLILSKQIQYLSQIEIFFNLQLRKKLFKVKSFIS